MHRAVEEGGELKKNLYHKRPVEITSKITKRPYLKIMEKIRKKLFERLRAYIGPEHADDQILEALKDHHIECSIKKMMTEKRI